MPVIKTTISVRISASTPLFLILAAKVLFVFDCIIMVLSYYNGVCFFDKRMTKKTPHRKFSRYGALSRQVSVRLHHQVNHAAFNKNEFFRRLAFQPLLYDLIGEHQRFNGGLVGI